MQRSGDARGNYLILFPPTIFLSIIEEREKYRHLKYVKTSVNKTQSNNSLARIVQPTKGGIEIGCKTGVYNYGRTAACGFR